MKLGLLLGMLLAVAGACGGANPAECQEGRAWCEGDYGVWCYEGRPHMFLDCTRMVSAGTPQTCAWLGTTESCCACVPNR